MNYLLLSNCSIPSTRDYCRVKRYSTNRFGGSILRQQISRGAGHSTGWHNLRFYYNPITGLLEPVVFDALPLEPSATREQLAFPFAEKGYIQKIFRIPGIQKSYVSYLEHMTDPAYLDELESLYSKEIDHFHQILTSYFEKGIFGDIPPLPWTELRQRARILSKNLESPQPIQGNYRITQLNNREYLQLDLTNLMVLPVELREIEINDQSYPFKQAWCSEANCLESLLIEIPPLVLSQYSTLNLMIPTEEVNFSQQIEPVIAVKAVFVGAVRPFD